MADNFEQIITALTLAEEIIGETKNVTFDSCVYKHDFFRNHDETPQEIQERHALDIHTIYASEERPVTLSDISSIFMEMQEQFEKLNTGQSYFFQGINYDPEKDMYVVSWGS